MPTPRINPAKAANKKAARKSTRPQNPRVRVRMYRQGLGDCFLLSFPQEKLSDFHMLIDCGALKGTGGTSLTMESVVRNIAEETGGKLDLLVVTHEHWDHVSGFHQARELFDGIKINKVWMGWTEDPSDALARKIGAAREKTLKLLSRTLQNRPLAAAPGGPLAGVGSILEFFGAGDGLPATGQTTGAALEYLRERSRQFQGTTYLKPGTPPLELPGVEDVRVYVLGPPRDEAFLFKSDATKKEREDHVIFEARAGLPAAVCSLAAAIDPVDPNEAERYSPFSLEHRRDPGDGACDGFMDRRYNAAAENWRRIDEDWLGGMGQVALKLDSDTNNTSLVLAFEFVSTGEVLLFVGDAQVGNWLSWGKVEFPQPESNGTTPPLHAHDLVKRAVFYKCGHHGSHNATLQKHGIDLMQRDDLVVFIPVDKAMAATQGVKDKTTGVPKGWKMPARALFEALRKKSGNRVVLSDAAEALSSEAQRAGVTSHPLYIDYFLHH